jgi:lycopene beta-cyclase
MIIILGGGLSGSLLAYRLSQINPRPDFLLIEEKSRLGGEHTWSFHESDLTPESMSWVRGLVASSWDRQEVRFCDFNRVLPQRYHSVTSSRLRQMIQPQIHDRLLLNEAVLKVDSQCVYLKGKEIEAQVIFDARGLEQHQLNYCGFQKFVGMDLDLYEAHGLKHPVIMDATCKQEDGYRFFYLLPWNDHSILVEDTRYSLSSDLNVEELKCEIRDYCKRSGWTIRKEIRTEVGALPIPFAPFKIKPDRTESVRVGIRGDYFHWTTGYSFPLAVRVAEIISEKLERSPNVRTEDFIRALKPVQTELKKQSQYLSLLNRMLFMAAQPSERWKIFHRFYHLNEDLIFRFYQGKLKFRDQARILIGRPPVPIYSALKSIFNPKKNPEGYGK